jgi:transposase
MRHRPEARGYFANQWTVPLLQEELVHCTGQNVSADTIRRSLDRLGYVWKRARYVLAPDPEKGKKTPDFQGNQAFASTECIAC